jgi:F420H(2)-dependent quinone reductase
MQPAGLSDLVKGMVVAEDSSSAVTRQAPPKLLIAVFNPIFGALLRSPLHSLVDKDFVILHLTGRRSGRRYSIVVGRHTLDGVLTVMTSSPWRLNIQGGADVEVTSDGQTRRGTAVLIEDREQATRAYAAEIHRIGWKAAQRTLGLKISVGREPTLDELRVVADRDHLSLIRITLQPST